MADTQDARVRAEALVRGKQDPQLTGMAPAHPSDMPATPSKGAQRTVSRGAQVAARGAARHLLPACRHCRRRHQFVTVTLPLLPCAELPPPRPVSSLPDTDSYHEAYTHRVHELETRDTRGYLEHENELHGRKPELQMWAPATRASTGVGSPGSSRLAHGSGPGSPRLAANGGAAAMG
jgi:hypothetical protein